MPYTGKPSDACQRCKKLHTKCDGQRPTCRRCLKANHPCVRLAEGLDLVLRDQNNFAKTLVEKRLRVTTRQLPDSGSEPSEDDEIRSFEDEFQIAFGSDGSHSPPDLFWNIAPMMTENTEYHARNFFMRYYVDYSRDRRTDKGLPDLIPLLKNEFSSTGPLALAISAVSLVMYGGWEQQIRDSESDTARAAYVEALKATRAALQDPVMANADETVIAICMLGLYEAVINSYRACIASPRHYIGAAAVLKERIRQGHGNNEVFRRILAAVRSAISYRALHAGYNIDTESVILDETESSLRNPVEVMDFRVAKAAAVLSKVRVVDEELDMHGHTLAAQSIHDFNVSQLPAIQMVEDDLASWEFLVPASWLPTHCRRTDAPKSVVAAGFYGETCHVYPDIMICAQWNEWRIARLRVLAYLAVIDPNGDAAHRIQSLIDEICATIPFILGNRTKPGVLYATDVEYPVAKDRLEEHRVVAAAYGGWNIFTPLKTAYILNKYTRRWQQEWIGMQLKRLAYIHSVTPASGPQFAIKTPYTVGTPLPVV